MTVLIPRGEFLSQKEMQMMKICRIVITALVMTGLLPGLSGCIKQEGPAEHAGRKIDKTVEKADSRSKRQVIKCRRRPKENSIAKERRERRETNNDANAANLKMFCNVPHNQGGTPWTGVSCRLF